MRRDRRGTVKLKRASEEPAPEDGARTAVDVYGGAPSKKQDAKIDHRSTAISPGNRASPIRLRTRSKPAATNTRPSPTSKRAAAAKPSP